MCSFVFADFYLPVYKRCSYRRFVRVCIYIERGADVFGHLLTGADPERLLLVMYDLEIGFAGDGDHPAGAGEGGGIGDGAGGIEPDAAAIGQGQLVLTALGSG